MCSSPEVNNVKLFSNLAFVSQIFSSFSRVNNNLPHLFLNFPLVILFHFYIIYLFIYIFLFCVYLIIVLFVFTVDPDL